MCPTNDAESEPLFKPYSWTRIGSAGVGYIKTDDLRKILHNLGAGLPHWLVKDLIYNVVDMTRRGRTDRVYYQSITDVEIREASDTKEESA